MSWVYLGAAIVLEVIGTTSLKLSHGLTRLWPSVLMAICYVGCFACLAQALKRVEVGVAYAIWSGVGIALLTGIGVLFFRESVSPLKLISIGLIIAGIIGVHLSGGSHP